MNNLENPRSSNPRKSCVGSECMGDGWNCLPYTRTYIYGYPCQALNKISIMQWWGGGGGHTVREPWEAKIRWLKPIAKIVAVQRKCSLLPDVKWWEGQWKKHVQDSEKIMRKTVTKSCVKQKANGGKNYEKNHDNDNQQVIWRKSMRKSWERQWVNHGVRWLSSFKAFQIYC